MKRFEFVVDGKTYEVDVASLGLREATVVVNGQSYDVAITRGAAETAAPRPAASQLAVPLAAAPVAPAAAPVGGATPGAIVAPMPGLILEFLVGVGDAVSPGDTVVRMEAMKMENDIKTMVGGVVKEIVARKGADVSVGEVLLVVG